MVPETHIIIRQLPFILFQGNQDLIKKYAPLAVMPQISFSHQSGQERRYRLWFPILVVLIVHPLHDLHQA